MGAIQTDVQEDDANEERFNQLEEIAKKNNAIEFPKEEELEETETEEETEETETEEETEEEETEELEEETEEDIEDYITIKVDGEEQLVPLSKIKDAGIRTLQKESSADKRLQEATELLKKAKTQPDIPLPKDAEISDAELEDIVTAIREGTDEEAIKATKKLYTKGAQPDVSTIINHELNMRDIKNRFELPAENGGFADLFKNKVAKIAVVSLVNERLQGGEPNTWETYEAAGKEVREALGVKTSLVERKKKKKKIDNLETANKVKTKPKEQKPPTRSEAIKEMAKSRVAGFI